MRRRPTVLALALLATTTWVGFAGASRGPRVASSGSVIGFASPTVVNEFVPGFEPDVVVDASHTASRGRLYSSWPNGFSTTISYLDRSDDNGDSFHPTAGSVGGKPFSCVGGGDSELQVNGKNGQLLLADLQATVNFSTSASTDGGDTFVTSCTGVTGSGVDRQWMAIDDNGGTSSLGTGAGDGRAYLVYDNTFQNTGNPIGNSPVINASSDGVNFGGCLDPTATVCKAPAAVISTEDDIVGNLFLDGVPTSPRYHAIYQVRGNSSRNQVLLSTCRGAVAGMPTTAAATAAVCTNPTLVAPGDPGLVNTHWSDHVVSALPKGYGEQAFVVGAMDTTGNIYVTWVQYKQKSRAFVSDGQVMLARSTDGGNTWSKPIQVNPPSQATVIFPWITAGDPGRVDLAWYAAPQSNDHGLRGPDALGNGTWDVEFAQSLDALSSTPTFALARVSDHHVKYSGISTGGITGSADRSLGDYLQIKTGVNGEALVSYVDDTSGNRNNDITFGSGQTPAEASGPTMLGHQVAGPSLYAAKGLVGAGKAAVDETTDPVGVGYPDSYLSLAGNHVSSSPALDIAGVSVGQVDATHLTITLRTADPTLAAHLAPGPTSGGLFANWRVRWAGRYGTTGNDGQIYYVGMQAGPDGTPEFYVGKTSSIDSTRTKYYAYPTGTAVPGTIDGNAITWTVPTDAIGTPKAGDGLFSVTGFTATSAIPDRPIAQIVASGGQVGDEDTLTANQLDAAPSFSYTLRSGRSPAHGNGRGTRPGAGGQPPLAATGLGLWIPLGGLFLLLGFVLMRRRPNIRRR